MNKQEPIEFNSRLDKDPDHLEKLDLLFKEEMLEPGNLSMRDVDMMFVEHVIKSATRYISDFDQLNILKHLDLDALKIQALTQMYKRTGLIPRKVQQDRITASFYSGVNSSTSTSVSIPIYITVTFIKENK